MWRTIKELLSKYKSVLGMFIFVFIIAAIWWNAKYEDNDMRREHLIGGECSSWLPEIVDGHVVSQTFKMPDHRADEILVPMVTFGKNLAEEEEFKVKVTLKEENGPVLREYIIGSAEIVDNITYAFEVNEKMKKDVNYELLFETEGASIGGSFSVRTAEGNEYEDGRLTIDNEDSGKNISFVIVSEYKSFAKKFFWLFTLLIAVLSSVCWLICRLWENKAVEYKYAITIAIIGTIYLFLIPPMTAPDEPYHFMCAYKISNVLTFTPKADEGNEWIRQQDLNKMNYGSRAGSYYDFYSKDIRIDEAGKNEKIQYDLDWGSELRVGAEYWISGVIIAICRILHFDGRVLILAGAWGNLLFYVIAIFWAIRIVPYGKNSLGMISLMPMLVSLISSYSYDPFNFALICLFLAFSTKFIYTNYYKISNIEWAGYCAIAFFFAPVKVIYVSFLLLEFGIPKERFANRKQERIMKIVLLMSAAVGLLAFKIDSIISAVNRGIVVPETIESAVSVQEIIHMWANTFVSSTNFFVQSMIGSLLSRLTVPVNETIIMGFGVLLAIAAICERCSIDITKRQRVLYRVSMMLGLISVFGLATIIWRDREAGIFIGLQGRYFMPYLALIPWILDWKCNAKGDISNKVILYTIILHVFTSYEVLQYIFE